MRIPKLIQFFQCRNCSFNGQLKNPAAICIPHNGLYPVLWTNFRLFSVCNSRRNDLVLPTVPAPEPLKVLGMKVKVDSTLKGSEFRLEPRRGIVPASEVAKVRKSLEIRLIMKTFQQERIAEANRTRRTKFAHSEHFKQRQPTTARKLWNPQAKVEEEENA